jgi:glycosyltransferase involved in cell wall biosynthesis
MSPNPTTARICYVLSHFHPVASGAERQAMLQGAELVRRGHQVRVVTRAIDGQPVDETMDGVRVHRWIRPITLGPLFGLSFVAGLVLALRRLRREYDLIHTHQALWEAIATGLGRPMLGGAPTLIQPASSGYFGEARELARTRGAPILRRAILRNTAFAAISAEIELEWRDLGVPPDRMARTVSGVDARHFHPGAASPMLEATLPPRPRVVFTGRLHPQKNLPLLLDAWPAVAARTGASLVLVGQGPEQNRLASHARKLGVCDRVHFAGPVADPADHLRAADAFVLPSVAEGMSNSLLEAMATGLPCLASAIGGNTDLLESSGAGLLLPPEPGAWSDALVRVLTDLDLARELGRSARRRVESHFSLDVVVDHYQQIYKRLLAGWPKEDRLHHDGSG